MASKALAQAVLWLTASMGLLVALGVVARFGVTPHDITLALGTLMVAVAEWYPLEMPQGTVNLASAAFFAVFLTAGVADALVVLAAGSCVTYLRQPFRGVRSLANMGNFLLSATAAWWVSQHLGFSLHEWIPFTATVLMTFLLVNHALVSVYYYLREGPVAFPATLYAMTWDVAGWLVTIPVAWMFYLLRAHVGIGAQVLVVVPFGALAVSAGLWQQVQVERRRLEHAASASTRIGSGRTEEQILRTLAEALHDTIGFREFYIIPSRPATFAVPPTRFAPAPDGVAASPASVSAAGAAAEVLRTGVPFVVRDCRTAPPALSRPDVLAAYRSAMVLPLASQSAVLGAALVVHGEPHHYRSEHVRLASILMGEAAMAIERVGLFRERERLAITDPMIPELYNVRHFRQALERAVETASVARPISVAFMDVDHFKAINDVYGHQAGDEILRATAAAIRRVIRSDDVLARYGGDEFVLLLDGVQLDGARDVVIRIEQALSALAVRGGERSVSVSVGLASCPSDADDVEGLLHLADTRMYLQKSARRAPGAESHIS